MFADYVGRWPYRALGMLSAAVISMPSAAQDPPLPRPTGSIEGVVYDSLLTRGPLRGATVYVVGTIFIASSDGRGRFAISGIPEGEHSLTFSHPALDSTGVQAPVVSVKIGATQRARVTLATPNGASILRAACVTSRGSATGLLLGVVREVDTGLPLPGARVRSRWFELTLERTGPRYQTLEATATADQNGVYRLCGIPSDIPVLVRADAEARESGRVEVYFGGRDVTFRDFAVSLTDSAALATPDSLLAASSDSAALAGRRGTSTVRGAVRDMTGNPVADAHVAFLDNGVSAITGSDGRFTLGGGVAGTQTLEVRALGYQPVKRAVVLKSNSTTDVSTTTLDRAAQKLASIRVTGTRAGGRATRFGFEERRRSTGGFFMDADEIAKKNGIYLGDVLRYAPGVTPQYTSRGRIFTMRSTANGDRCLPNYFLDGHRWFALEGSPILELERFMTLNAIEGVEVYRSGAGMPMQFDTGNGCGSVVFWTK